MNPYKILDIEPTATAKEIKKAYREKAKYYHPDLNKDKDAEKKFIKVVAAYDSLTTTTRSKPEVKVKVMKKRQYEKPKQPTKEEKRAQKEEVERRMREEIKDILYDQKYARRFDAINDAAMAVGGIVFMILLYFIPSFL